MTGALEQTPLYAQEHTDHGGAPGDGLIIKMCLHVSLCLVRETPSFRSQVHQMHHFVLSAGRLGIVT